MGQDHMDRILVATPLYGAASEHVFRGGLSICTMRPILWERSASRKLWSKSQEEAVSGVARWLSVSKEVNSWMTENPTDQAGYETVRRAMYAWQITRPTGCLNVYMKFVQTPEGFDCIGSSHPAEMKRPWIGRLASHSEDECARTFPSVYDGVSGAFDQKIVRLQNPILLMEHGLQTDHVYLSALMWVAGLDMLLMAGEKGAFVDRLIGLLGRDTHVFPPVLSPARQPSLTVGDAAEDLFELRNVVAHGSEIPATPFRQRFPIKDTNGNQINWQDFTYAQVLSEAALYLLAGCLRKVFEDGLVGEVETEANWKQRLKNGAEIAKRRA